MDWFRWSRCICLIQYLEQNHNPLAENGFSNALDILGPIWGNQQLTLLRSHFEGNMSWVNYQSSFGNIVDRFRWEAGCIVEHVSEIPLCLRDLAHADLFQWDQGEQFPDVAA